MNVQLSRRRFLKIAAITTGSLALAACAPAPTPAPAQKPAATTAPAAAPAATQPPAPTVAPAPKGTTTLRMAWWGGDPRHKKYNDILDMYEKLKPGIKIEREFAAYDAYWQKLATQVAGGNPPDLITNHQDLVNEYANRGALLALDALIEAKKIDLTDWPKGTVDSGKRNGKNWMLALGGTCASTMFNETWLKALGITIPANRSSGLNTPTGQRKSKPSCRLITMLPPTMAVRTSRMSHTSFNSGCRFTKGKSLANWVTPKRPSPTGGICGRSCAVRRRCLRPQ